MNRYKLKDLSLNKLEYGSGAAACEYDGSTRYVRITDIDNEGNLGEDVVSPNTVDDKYLLNDGDVLFARTGATVGKTYLYRASAGRCIYAGFLIRVVPNQELIRPDYLYYFTKSPQYKGFVQSSMKVVAQPNINAKQYGDLEFNVPSLSEQDSIIEKLKAVSTVIALRKTELLKLDELIKARFVELFSEYEWSTTIGNYIAELRGGKSLAGTEPCKNKVLKTGAATFGWFDPEQYKYLPQDYEPLQEHKVETGDVMISRMNTPELVGACSYVFEAPENMYYPDRLWKVITKNNANPIFIWQLLWDPEIRRQIKEKSGGTSGTMHNISKPKLLEIKCIDVPVTVQNDFADFVKQVDKSKVVVQNALKKADILFDSLMQTYFR